MDLCRGLEALLCLLSLVLFGGGHVLGVVEIPGLDRMIARQRNVIDPMPVGRHVVQQSALDGIPYADRFVMAAGIDHAFSLSSPPDAGYAPLVATEDVLGAARVDDPDANGAIFRGARETSASVAPDCEIG